MQDLSVIERPTIVRDRTRLLRAVAHALLASQVHAHNHPDETLQELSQRFLRDLGAYGIEVRVRR